MVSVLALTDVKLPPTVEATYVDDEVDLAHKLVAIDSFDVLVLETEKLSGALLRLILELDKPIVIISSSPLNISSLDKATLSQEELKRSIENAACRSLQYKEIENISVGIAHLSNDNCITHWNKSAEDITGVGRHEVLGKPYAEVFGSMYYDIRPIEQVLELLQCNGIVSFRIMKNDGTISYISIRCLSNGSKCSILQISDDTFSRVIIDRVRESEGRVTAILNTVQECVMQFDNAGCVTHNTKCGEYLGMSHEEISKLMHGQFKTGRYEIDGKWYDVQKKAFSIGGVGYTVVTIDDVTQVETLITAIGILANDG